MSRAKVDWVSGSAKNYKDFCKENPTLNLDKNTWIAIVYKFNHAFRERILETGEKVKMPYGFGEFSINKHKRRRIKGIGDKTFINLPIDWAKTREKGKVIYNFNYHTEGYYFRWIWFKEGARIKHANLWIFKASRLTSRLLAKYIKGDEKYQHIYMDWKKLKS